MANKQGWEVNKLENLCFFINGLWKGKKEPFINVGVIRNTNFTKECSFDKTNIEYLDVEEKQYTSRKLFYGDLILEKSGGSSKQPVGRIVPFEITTGEFSFSNFTSVLRIKDKNILFYKFLYFQLFNFYKNGRTEKLQSNTTGIRNLDLNSYKTLSILTPPLPVQNQIVKELDTLQAIITKKKAQLDELDKLAQATFYDMFGDPVENERGWESKIITKIADTIVPGRDKPKSFTGHIPWINTADLNNLGYINDSKSKLYLTKNEIAEVKAKIIPANSIIMTCVGDLGITSINSIEVVINQQLHSYQCHSSVNNIFVMFCLSLNKDYMYKMATSTTLPYMNKTVCNNISIPTPPLPLQNQFAKQIEAIEKQKALINQSIVETQLLFDSAMDNYFN